ncbi:hypothetical protein WEI85_05915 [Actinomycetes bacterium KLBMP 9797]
MDRQEGKRQLRRLRERRGWSWADEARAIKAMARRLSLDWLTDVAVSSIRRTIARWESDRTTSPAPDERYQRILHLYAERDGVIDIGPGSDFLELLEAFRSLGVPPERVDDLHANVASWSQCKPALPWRVDPADIAQGDLTDLSATLAAVMTRVGSVPFARSQVALAPYLDAFRHLELEGLALPPDAHALAADCFGAAGRLAFELRDDDAAKQPYATALRHADQAPDKWLVATVRTSLAMITMHRGGDLAATEQIANAAVRAAQDTSSMAARARAAAVQAEVAARRNHHRPARSALALAEHYTAKVAPDDPAGMAFDSARLAGFIGLHHLLTGAGAAATVDLERAARGITEDTNPIQRSIIIADLAHAHLAQPKPEPQAAVQALHECAAIVGRTRGRVATGRIRRVRRLLRLWSGERFLADLDDHVYATLLD